MAVSVGRFEVQSDILSLCSVCVSVCFVSEDFVLFLCDSSSSKVSAAHVVRAHWDGVLWGAVLGGSIGRAV